MIEDLVSQGYLPNRIVNILKEKHFQKEAEFYRCYEKLVLQYKNSYLLNGQFIEFYPIIKEEEPKQTFLVICQERKLKGEVFILLIILL